MEIMWATRSPSPAARARLWRLTMRSASGSNAPPRGLKSTKVHGLQHGGSFLFDGAVRVKLTVAFHGSVLPDGSNGGNPCGFLVTCPNGTKIYDAADTALFGDMALIGEEGLDLAILPIGDYYTMGPDDALRAVKLLEPRYVLPIHYSTFLAIAQDANAWAARGQERDFHPARRPPAGRLVRDSQGVRAKTPCPTITTAPPFPRSCRRCRYRRFTVDQYHQMIQTGVLGEDDVSSCWKDGSYPKWPETRLTTL